MTDPNPGISEPSQVMDLYKLAVEMADRVSARRASANSFFFTIQAGLAVALGAFGIKGDAGPTIEPDRFALTLAAIAGMLIAGSWWLLLRSYRDLNTAKFAVISRIEAEHLPVRLFNEEWEELKSDPVKRWRPRYAEQGQAERVVPVVFLAIYGVLALYVAFG